MKKKHLTDFSLYLHRSRVLHGPRRRLPFFRKSINRLTLRHFSSRKTLLGTSRKGFPYGMVSLSLPLSLCRSRERTILSLPPDKGERIRISVLEEMGRWCNSKRVFLVSTRWKRQSSCLMGREWKDRFFGISILFRFVGGVGGRCGWGGIWLFSTSVWQNWRGNLWWIGTIRIFSSIFSYFHSCWSYTR